EAVKADEERAQNEQNGQETNNDDFHLVGYTCPSCGAEVVTDSTTAATTCFYCQNPIVLESRLNGDFTPNKIVPFSITEKEAKEDFIKWTKKKKFIPEGFFSQKQIDKIAGVYFPHWIVDCNTEVLLNTTGEKVTTWRSGDMKYTNTKYFQIIREADIHFEDITRNALSKANKQLVDGVHPYSDKKLIDFKFAYLSGFQAEKRDIESTDLEASVNQEIIKYAKTTIGKTTTDFTAVSEQDASVDIIDTDWSYALLPVWTLTYKGKDGKIYYYSMNGDTGKMCGKLPIDSKKLWGLFAAITLPLFVILTIVGYII
ncbi:MAG: TFIIB-type zinc ribbon-containing protein, partial [Oscillospiraceae bacterium]